MCALNMCVSKYQLCHMLPVKTSKLLKLWACLLSVRDSNNTLKSCGLTHFLFRKKKKKHSSLPVQYSQMGNGLNGKWAIGHG